MLVGFSTKYCKIDSSSPYNVDQLTEEESRMWSSRATKIDNKLLKKKGLHVGPLTSQKLPPERKLHTLVYFQKLEGMRVNRDGTSDYNWSKKTKETALDLVVFHCKEIKKHDDRFTKYDQPLTLSLLYPIDQLVVVYNALYLGRKARIANHLENGKLLVELFPQQNPILLPPHLIKNNQSQLFDLDQLAHRFGFTSHSFSIFTGSLFILDSKKRKYDVGLALKFQSQGKQRNQYCFFDQSNLHLRTGRGSWMFTSKTVELMESYRKQFPQLIEFAKNYLINPQTRTFSTDVFLNLSPSEADEMLYQVFNWISKQPHQSFPLVATGSQILDPSNVAQIEQILISHNNKEFEMHNSTTMVELEESDVRKPIFDPLILNSNYSSSFELGDRVINLMEDRDIPFATCGFVIGTSHNLLMVMWDITFIGGLSENGCLSERVDSSVLSSTVLNISRYTVSSFWNLPNKNFDVKSSISQRNPYTFHQQLRKQNSPKQLQINSSNSQPKINSPKVNREIIINKPNSPNPNNLNSPIPNKLNSPIPNNPNSPISNKLNSPIPNNPLTSKSSQNNIYLKTPKFTLKLKTNPERINFVSLWKNMVEIDRSKNSFWKN